MPAQGAEKIAQRARENLCSDRPTETRSYNAYRNNRAMVTGISPTARKILDIEEGTELKQFVDVEEGAVIIVPQEGGD